MRTNPGRISARIQTTWLAGAFACSLSIPAWAQQKLTVEQLQQRLDALERRVEGTSPVGRYAALEVDDDALPPVADPDASAREVRSWTLGPNWYLSSNLKLVLNCLQTPFDGCAVAGADREDGRALFTRLQIGVLANGVPP